MNIHVISFIHWDTFFYGWHLNAVALAASFGTCKYESFSVEKSLTAKGALIKMRPLARWSVHSAIGGKWVLRKYDNMEISRVSTTAK